MTMPKIEILVVQDYYASRNVIKYILKQTGFRDVVTVQNGGEALNKLRDGQYSIVISDWHMPVMDGLSLLKSIREETALKDLLFILVTSESDRDKVLEAKQAGVDEYLMKPFTAESLCRKIIAGLRSRLSDASGSGRSPVKPANEAKPGVKVFGQAAAASGKASPKNWSISLSPSRFKPQSVVKHNLTATMSIMSRQLDRMKADSGFISAGEMIEKVEATMKNTEHQAEHAALIADSTNNISSALADVESLPAGSPESARKINELNNSAAKLADMVDSFDREIADVIGMLNGIDHMVGQAHVSEINKSIRASFLLETGQEDAGGAGAPEELSGVSEEVAVSLSRIRTESETAREALTTAAEGITQVIDRIKAPERAAHSSLETFQELGTRISRVMDMLDKQISLSATLVTDMEEVAAVEKEVIETAGPEKTDEPVAARPGRVKIESPQQVSAPQLVSAGRKKDDVQSALKKMIGYRILMIDIILKDHGYCIRNLEKMVYDSVECHVEELPGRTVCSLSKWIDQRMAQKDIYDDVDVCRQVMQLRDDMHSYAMKAMELYRSGRKDEGMKSYRKADTRSGRIEELLKTLQDDLRKKV